MYVNAEVNRTTETSLRGFLLKHTGASRPTKYCKFIILVVEGSILGYHRTSGTSEKHYNYISAGIAKYTLLKPYLEHTSKSFT